MGAPSSCHYSAVVVYRETPPGLSTKLTSSALTSLNNLPTSFTYLTLPCRPCTCNRKPVLRIPARSIVVTSCKASDCPVISKLSSFLLPQSPPERHASHGPGSWIPRPTTPPDLRPASPLSRLDYPLLLLVRSPLPAIRSRSWSARSAHHRRAQHSTLHSSHTRTVTLRHWATAAHSVWCRLAGSQTTPLPYN